MPPFTTSMVSFELTNDVVPVLERIATLVEPRSIWLYSILADQLGAKPHSIPPPMV
jgi:hypothetical protein